MRIKDSGLWIAAGVLGITLLINSILGLLVFYEVLVPLALEDKVGAPVGTKVHVLTAYGYIIRFASPIIEVAQSVSTFYIAIVLALKYTVLTDLYSEDD